MSADSEANVDSQPQQISVPVPEPQPEVNLAAATPPEFNPALMAALGSYLRSNPQSLDELFKQHASQPANIPPVEPVAAPIAVQSEPIEPANPEPVPEAKQEPTETESTRILTAAERFIQINEQFVELARSGSELNLSMFVVRNVDTVQIRFRNFAAWWASIENANLETCKYLRNQFCNELGNRRYEPIFVASSQGNAAGVVMLLNPASGGLDGRESIAAIEVAGENGNAEIMDLLLGCMYQKFGSTRCLMAAIDGTLRSDNTELLDTLLGQLRGDSEVAKNKPKRNFRCVLIQAARSGSPTALDKVLSTLDMEFQHKSTSNHALNTLDSSYNTGSVATFALLRAFNICATNPDTRLVNLLIDMFGEDMRVGDRYNHCLTSGCKNGHAKLVKLLITKHKFADISGYADIARTHDQAEVLAVLFDKYGLDAIISAPEHIPRTNELLRQHYSTLVGRFST